MTWNISAYKKYKPARHHKPAHYHKPARHHKPAHYHKPARHHKPYHHHEHTKTECTPPTPTPNEIPCCHPGSRGFKNSGFIRELSSPVKIKPCLTAEQCCEACFNNPNCVEWFLSLSDNLCFMSTNAKTCNNILNQPLSNATSYGGIMRCDTDGCLASTY
ncbi:16401_t:CDS:1 [Gigaspora rosea]|nr:16401_t:CDS:1 [Gigaspora rosea]